MGLYIYILSRLCSSSLLKLSGSFMFCIRHLVHRRRLLKVYLISRYWDETCGSSKTITENSYTNIRTYNTIAFVNVSNDCLSYSSSRKTSPQLRIGRCCRHFKVIDRTSWSIPTFYPVWNPFIFYFLFSLHPTFAPSSLLCFHWVTLVPQDLLLVIFTIIRYWCVKKFGLGSEWCKL